MPLGRYTLSTREQERPGRRDEKGGIKRMRKTIMVPSLERAV